MLPKRNHSHEKPRHTTIERPLSPQRENRLHSNDDTARLNINKINKIILKQYYLRLDSIGQYLVLSLGKLTESSVHKIKKSQLTVPSEVWEALHTVLRAQVRSNQWGPKEAVSALILRQKKGPLRATK